MSPKRDSALADPQQVIADLQRRLADAEQRAAERTAERDEALARETAAAEVLQVINSSPGDLAPVFELMLERATRLCDATFGIMSTFDGEHFHWGAVHNVPTPYAEFMRDEPPQPSPKSALGRIRNGERLVHIEDYAQDPGYEADDPRRRALVELGGARGYVAVGLYKDDKLLGTLSTYRQEPRPFSEREIALLQNFAAQAVIAMENARLITETREALEQQTATAEVLGVINSSPGNLAPVFEAMLEKALHLCEASFGILWTYDGEYMHASAITGVPPQFAEFLKQGPHRPAPTMQQDLLSGRAFGQIADLTKSEGYQSGETLPRAGADLGGVRTLLGVTLRKDDRVLGIFGIYRQEVRPFTDKQVALLQNFAQQAVIAIENARLLTETREALEQQTATAEVLQVINSSPGDLEPVFDVMLERAVRLCEFDFALLWTYDGTSFCPVAKHRVPEPLWEYLQEHTPPAFARLVGGDHLVHIADVWATDQTDFSRNVRRLGLDTVRSILIIPLRKDETLLGLIAAYRREVGPFSGKQIALLQNFAAQAVIAMENARLITETREALEQQTATAEVLGVINSSPGDLAPVFNAMLEKAVRLCEADFGVLNTFSGERWHPTALHNVPLEYAEFIRREPLVFPPDSAIGRIVAGETVAHFVDTAAEAGRAPPLLQTLQRLGNIRSAVFAALRKDGLLLGVIIVYRQEVRPFTDKHIALLQNFAAQAVIAMENARLITETREALEQQTATAEVLGVINSSPGDLSPVFEAILEKAHTLCDAAFGSLFTYDGEFFHGAASHGLPEAIRPERRGSFRPGPNNPLWELARGAPLAHVADMKELASLSEPSEPGHLQLRAAIEQGDIRTMLMVPLRKDGALLGVISAFRQEVKPFTDKQIALLQNFAAQAVIAMENARLLGELRQRTEEVAELNRGLEARVAEQVDELGRVGRLKRFLAPQLAELIVSQGDEKILESHRREIVVVFCDLRGYTAFTETAEPEEVLDFLREYHGALGPLVAQFEGTLDQFSGDGIMVFFNDPVPIPDPAERAVKMAVAMRETAGTLIAAWRRRGRELGFGAGIAQGYATLGQIGFADRSGYTAIGTVCNLAARLCAQANDGQILLGQRVAVAVEQIITLEEVGSLTLKGLTQPVVACNVPLAATQPALRVIEGGPPQSV